MPSDARLNTGLAGHHKTKKLLRRLGPAGPWGLVCLFLWTAANRSDGDLSGMSVEDIELAADWTGEPEALVMALSEVGFLDGGPGDFRIHDWAEHNPWAAGAEDRAEASRWAALCKRYGRAGAADRMPEYAIRMRPAHEPHAPLPSPSPLPSPIPDQKQKRPARTAPDRPEDVPQSVWDDWLALRRAKKAPVTETVLRTAVTEAGKAGMTLTQFLTVWCARGSQGLEAEWLNPKERGNHNAVDKDRSAVGRVNASIERNRAARGETIDGEAVRILRGDALEPDGGDLRTPLGFVLRG